VSEKRRYIVMLVDKGGGQLWLSKWDGFHAHFSEKPAAAFFFHWPETAQRTAVKLVVKHEARGYKVFELVKDKEGKPRAEPIAF